jgi:thymidylate synthase (FAD)
MELIHPSHEIKRVGITPWKWIKDGPEAGMWTGLAYGAVEEPARECYLSLPKGDTGAFLRGRLNDGHRSVFEHVTITAKFVVDRGISHELVRHRLAAYSQQSTRYVNYTKRGVKFVIPPGYRIEPRNFDTRPLAENPGNLYTGKEYAFIQACSDSEASYNLMTSLGEKPQIARGALNHWLATSIYATYNVRVWRHILWQRTGVTVHPGMYQVMYPCLMELGTVLPVFFGDIMEERQSLERRNHPFKEHGVIFD